MEPISKYEIREELRRVLQSRGFARARKRSRFLEFVCEQALLGKADDINEFLIGVEVYERGTDFDPQADAIVRVQACEIRRALKEYYAEDGANDPWRIDLPVGHYVPVFARAPEAVSAAPRAAAASPPVAVQHRWLRRHGAVIALSIACVAFASLWAIEHFRRPAAPAAGAPLLPSTVEWFWQPFLPPADPPLIVLPTHPLLRAAHDGDTPATLKQGHLIEKDKIPQFRDTIHFRELQRFLFVPDTTDFTGVGEALGLRDLFDFFAAARQKSQLKQARLVDFEAVKRSNAILLGGSQSWSGRIFLYPEGFWLRAGVILNKTPRKGELAVYKPEFDPLTNRLRRDYALVLMLPNENPGQRILLVYGVYTQGTQAGMEYITNPERLRELRKELLAVFPQGIPKYFQVLLATTVENQVPGKVSFVAARAVPER